MRRAPRWGSRAPRRCSSHLADDALDEIVHLLEHHVRLLMGHAVVDDGLARVVLERPLEDHVAALDHLGLYGVGALPDALRHRLAVGPSLDELLLEAAA